MTASISHVHLRPRHTTAYIMILYKVLTPNLNAKRSSGNSSSGISRITEQKIGVVIAISTPTAMLTAASITTTSISTAINTVAAATATTETTMEEEKTPLAIVLQYHCNLKANSKRRTSGRRVCKEPQSCRFHPISLPCLLLLQLPVKQTRWTMVPSSGRTICWWQYLDFLLLLPKSPN